MSVVYDILAQPLELDGDGNVLVDGERILDVMLDDGTYIVKDGDIVFNGTLDIATVNFLAQGGDQYFDENYLSQSYSFTNLGASDQQSLADYISGFNFGDLVADPRYDAFPDGRITAVPEPAGLGWLILAIVGILIGKTRR